MEWLKRDCISYRGSKSHKKALPFKDGEFTKQFKISCLFLGGKTKKSRKDILLSVNEFRVNEHSTFNASLFQTLLKNEIIKYDGEYKAGERFKEYAQYCAKELVRLGLHKRFRKLYANLLKESSNAMHFIMTD